ncbi:hypothetical protein BC826DRAFT_999005 [Russula brevipes]|nr:hypothetical protein BC826DRAFT_999005 [Russula brevipes]
MLLSGLLSATGRIPFTVLPKLTDEPARRLGQICQQQASSNASEVQSPPVPPKPASTPNATHAFWFASLVLSLASAVFATLVQEWVRRYLLLTQPRLSPHRRARQFLGLFLSHFMTITRRGSSRGTTWDPYIHTDGEWLMLDHAILGVEKLAESRSSMLDVGVMSWLLGALGQDQELEQFLAGIPGFYRSKRVEDPAEVLRALNTNRLPKFIPLSLSLFSHSWIVHYRIII